MTRLTIPKQGFRIVSVCENRPRVATRRSSQKPLSGGLGCVGCFSLCDHGLGLQLGAFSFDRTLVADSAAGMWESRYCGFRLETAERVAKAAPLVERLPGVRLHQGMTKGAPNLGMARCAHRSGMWHKTR